MIGIPFAGEHGASRALQGALRTLKYHHVVDLTSGFEDAGNHGDKEHSPDRLGIRRRFGAEIIRKPRLQPRLAVPNEPGEIVANRMKSALCRPHVHRLMSYI